MVGSFVKNSVTNRVASPVKCVEYLPAGLVLILSNELGDYSNYVLTNKAGFIWNNEVPIDFLMVSIITLW